MDNHVDVARCPSAALRRCVSSSIVGSLDPRIDQEEGYSGRVKAKSPPIGVDGLAADWMADMLKAHQGAQDGKTCE
jgi:hypothetical protein